MSHAGIPATPTISSVSKFRTKGNISVCRAQPFQQSHGESLRTFRAQGILFDLDGTMVNSIAAVERAWRAWAVEHGLDPDYVAPRIHGRRAVDSIAVLGPHLDQIAAFERLEHLEATDVKGVVPMPGIHEFLEKLEDVPWGIVTSGTRAIALPRLRAAGIAPPDVLVTAEQISHGKPHPEAFLAGASRLGLPPESILAFEDTLAGVMSAKASGMKVVGLTVEASAEADHTIDTFAGIELVRAKPGFMLGFN